MKHKIVFILMSVMLVSCIFFTPKVSAKMNIHPEDPEQTMYPYDPGVTTEVTTAASTVRETEIMTTGDYVIEVTKDVKTEVTTEAEVSTDVTVEDSGEGTVEVDVKTDTTVNVDTSVKSDIYITIIEPTEEDYRVNVTELYSVNNSIQNCYYRPLFSEIPNLEGMVSKEGKFASVYTGYFDLDRTEAYRGEDSVVSRALSILGNDFLLSNENFQFDVGSGVISGKYTTEECSINSVDKLTAVMDIYKAIGNVTYDVKVKTKPVSYESLKNSPAILNLPGYVDDINTNAGDTYVFTTRTNKDKYKSMAISDKVLASEECSEAVTVGEFIKYAAYLMNLYGEPVINQQELYQLLQVFGSDIPEYLDEAEREAYIYLFARGCINESLDYTSNITRDQMLSILMCIADEGSRTDLKQVQLTVDLDSELIKQGYFKKTVTITNDSNAPSIDVKLDMSTVDRFDYYILITDETRFKSSTGADITSNIYIDNGSGERLIGTSYKGIEYIDGQQYYHLTCNILSAEQVPYIAGESVNYPECFKVNTVSGTDTPGRLWLPWGGGVYTVYQVRNNNDDILLKRQSFDSANESSSKRDTVWSEQCADNVRRQAALGRTAKAGIFSRLVSMIGVKNVYADSDYDMYATTAIVTIKNADAITNLDELIGYRAGTVKTDEPNTVIWRVKKEKVNVFLARIKRDPSKFTSETFTTAISSIAGSSDNSIMISYKELEKKGLVTSTTTSGDGNTVPQPDNDGNIEFWTIAGFVRLNNSTHEIIVGNVIYRVNDSVQLYYQPTSDGLLIDFRVIYGWINSKNALRYGSGNGYTITLSSGDYASKYANVINSDVYIKFPQEYTDNTGTMLTAQIVKKGVFDSISPKYVVNYGYALSNWIIYYGLEDDYLFIFYPREAFTSWGLTFDGLSTMDDVKRITGYTIPSGDAWVVRIIKLNEADSGHNLQRSNANTTVGEFMYDDEFGYLYNLPDWSSYSNPIDYLQGKVLLPLYVQSNSIKNINVNMFVNNTETLRFGYVPVGIKWTEVSEDGALEKDALHSVVDLKGNEVLGVNGQAVKYDFTKLEIIPTPAGVVSWFGGIQNKAGTIGADNNVLNLISTKKNGKWVDPNGLRIFYGTMIGRLEKYQTQPPTLNITLRDGYGSSNNGRVTVVGLAPDEQNLMLYLIGAKKTSDSSRSDEVYYYYSVFGNVFTSQSIKVEESGEVIEEIEEQTDVSIEYVGSEDAGDEWEVDGKHGLDRMISIIDKGSSIIVLIIFQIIPLLGITSLTVLVAFSMLSDNKLVLWFCDHVFDPVYFLTLGHRRCGELQLRNSLVGLIIGYIVFILLMNGIVFRIISWISSAFVFIVKHWK